MRACNFAQCNNKYYAKGYCNKHYLRLIHNGSPDKVLINRSHSENCAVEGCNKKYKGLGYCSKHYRRFKKHKDPEIVLTLTKKFTICTMVECNKKHHSGGFCQMHYRRNKLYGDPNIKINIYRDYSFCSVEGCSKEHSSKGYCKRHYHSILKPEISRQAKRRRRAKKLENGIEYYTEKQVLDTYGTSCYLCKKPIDMGAPRTTWSKGWEFGLHIEHVFDIALGGPDTLENVRPAHGICNLKKKPRKMV